MKTFSMFRALFIVIAVVLGHLLYSQVNPSSSDGVTVNIKGLNIAWTNSSTGSASVICEGQTVVAAFSESATAQMTPVLEVGKVYSVSGQLVNSSAVTIEAVPPLGYDIIIEGVRRQRMKIEASGYYYISIQVVPPKSNFTNRAGVATSFSSGRIFWEVSLGSVSNGDSAGTLAIIDTGAGAWGNLFSPAGFSLNSDSSEVITVYNTELAAAPYVPGTIRQIRAPEACVDIVVTSTNQAEIKFYSNEQATWDMATAKYTFVGDPFAWYLINQDGAAPNRANINCDLRNIPTASASSLPVAITKHTSVERTGTAPNFSWTADQWYDNGGSVEARTNSVRTGMSELVTVQKPGVTAALSVAKKYALMPWGEEVVEETIGTTNPLKHTYAFYTTDTQSGDYGHLKYRQDSDGNWEAYEYYDSMSDGSGLVHRIHRPFTNSDLLVPSDLSKHAGSTTVYEYAPDVFGRRTRPTLIETSVNGVVTSRSKTTYVDSDEHAFPSLLNALFLVTATRTDYSSDSEALTTITRYFREDAATVMTSQDCWEYNDFFCLKPHSIQYPDGRKDSYLYQRGSWGGTTFTLGGNSGLTDGQASRIAIIHGMSAGGYQLTTQWDYDIDDVYLLDAKSTMDVSYRDNCARICREEKYVWTNGAWEMIAWEDFNYNLSNQLSSRSNSKNEIYEAHYDGDRVEWEKDWSGLKTSYSYDHAGRPEFVTKSAAGEISALKTKFSYNALGNITEQLVGSDQAESLTTSFAYDDAGRISSETLPGISIKSYAYDPSARKRTVTNPNLSKIVEEYFADGRLSSRTGTGVVAEYYTYEIIDGGVSRLRSSVGSLDSARYSEVLTDWLGRTTQISKPGFKSTGSAVITNLFNPITGQKAKTTRTGYAPTLFEYDGMAAVTAVGLHFGTGDALVDSSTDRITREESKYEKIGTSWWRSTTTKVYATDSSATASVLSTQKERFTGLATDQVSEIHTKDADGNDVATIVTVDRSISKVTSTKSGPCDCAISTEVLENGLLTSLTTKDNRTFQTKYDVLWRKSKEIDSRNSNTVQYLYQSGTTLISDISNALNQTVSSFGYYSDGRQSWKKNASGHFVRTEYDDLGRIFRTWGDGAYPVTYEYDPVFGDLVSHTTFRNAPEGDSEKWPAVGTGDKSTLIYDSGSGLLWKRKDASIAQNTIEYEFNLRGQVTTKKLSRKLTTAGKTTEPVTTTYGYSDTTGELTSKTYNDALEVSPTSSLAFTYNRLGLLETVTDSGGAGRSFKYDSDVPYRLTSETLSADFGSRRIGYLYDSAGAGETYHDYTTGHVAGRFKGFQLGTSEIHGRDLTQAYVYSETGRMIGVTTQAGQSAVQEYVYTYVPNSRLLAGYSIGNYSVSYGYEDHRDLRDGITSSWNGAVVAKLAYQYNANYQRVFEWQSGSVFRDYFADANDSTKNFIRGSYVFDSRGQLQSKALYRAGSGTPSTADELPARRFEYRYDSIGNRLTSGSTGDKSLGDDEYVPNALNQYESKENVRTPVTGTVGLNANVAVAGIESVGKLDRVWGGYISPDNSSGALSSTVTVYSAQIGSGPSGTDLLSMIAQKFFIPKRHQVFVYDSDGNMISDGIWSYIYDAENRLVCMSNLLPSATVGVRKRLDFKYDYLGRRVEKKVTNLDSNLVLSSRRYIYHGNSIICELNESGSDLVRSYTWGLDLAGGLDSLDGLGALIRITNFSAGNAANSYLPAFDGSGNVIALTNASTGALAAAYEYDPYGNPLRDEAPDSGVADQPFRHSTRWRDEETFLYYYEKRYYSPRLGRFISRDPLAEFAGANFYTFAANNPADFFDRRGLSPDVVNPNSPIGIPKINVYDPTNSDSGWASWGGVFNLGGLDTSYSPRGADDTSASPLARPNTPMAPNRMPKKWLPTKANCDTLRALFPAVFRKPGEKQKLSDARVTATIASTVASEKNNWEYRAWYYKTASGGVLLYSTNKSSRV